MKILITGATGFIGSNIAKKLVEIGSEVYATRRSASSFQRCVSFKDRVNWINTDESGWKDQIRSIKPDQLIHAAWSGIESDHRNNWDLQIANFHFAKELFDLAKDCGVKKVIALGSQAEYGNHDQPLNEETCPVPVDAYGAVKTLTAHYLRNVAFGTSTEWYWIRVFSVFGDEDNPNWLIPFVIGKLLKNEIVPLTECNQEYDYIYIEDFSDQLMSVIQCPDNKSGIYNLCSSEPVILREILLNIADLTGVPHSLLKFGEVPRRPGQIMRIKGDNSKFREYFSIENCCKIGLTAGLIRTIEYFKNKQI
jgi:nucleoside-diphosphate-sugar epimerase